MSAAMMRVDRVEISQTSSDKQQTEPLLAPLQTSAKSLGTVKNLLDNTGCYRDTRPLAGLDHRSGHLPGSRRTGVQRGLSAVRNAEATGEAAPYQRRDVVRTRGPRMVSPPRRSRAAPVTWPER